jgi:hypothetical protein
MVFTDPERYDLDWGFIGWRWNLRSSKLAPTGGLGLV